MTTPIRAALERLVAAVKPKYTDPEDIVEVASAVLAARAALKTEPEGSTNPSGYAYRYHDYTGGTYIKFNGGGEVNGSRPIEAVPYWFAPPSVPTTPSTPEPGEVGELVELLKLAGRWATSTGVQLDRFAALFDHQEAELAALRGRCWWVRLRIAKAGIRAGYNLGHHHTVEGGWGDPDEVADDFAQDTLDNLDPLPAPQEGEGEGL